MDPSPTSKAPLWSGTSDQRKARSGARQHEIDVALLKINSKPSDAVGAGSRRVRGDNIAVPGRVPVDGVRGAPIAEGNGAADVGRAEHAGRKEHAVDGLAVTPQDVLSEVGYVDGANGDPSQRVVAFEALPLASIGRPDKRTPVDAAALGAGLGLFVAIVTRVLGSAHPLRTSHALRSWPPDEQTLMTRS